MPDDDEFASVVLDEDFIRSAAVHEPSALDRLLAADRARTSGESGAEYDMVAEYGVYDEDPDDLYAQRGPYRVNPRWHRVVAWVLAVAMGVGVIALSFAAVHRGAAGGRPPPAAPPATGSLDVPVAPPLVAVPQSP